MKRNEKKHGKALNEFSPAQETQVENSRVKTMLILCGFKDVTCCCHHTNI